MLFKLLKRSILFHSSGHFIKGIEKELSTFRSSSVVDVRREANCAAHTRALEAVNNGYDLSWLEEIPTVLVVL
jgi:hypothetical protein